MLCPSFKAVSPLTLSAAILFSASSFVAQPVGASGSEEEVARHNLSAGAFYSRGKYGEQSDTSIYYYPLAYDYSYERWNFRLTVPYLRIAGMGNVIVNVGGVRADSEGVEENGRENGGEGDDVEGVALWPGRIVEDGVGDAVLSGSYQLGSPASWAPFIDLTLEAKLPTADERRSLGTGELDLAVQLDFYQALGPATVFTTLGYRHRGRSELFPGLKGSVFVSLGLAQPLTRDLTLGLIYDYRQAAAEFSGESQELLPYISWSPAQHWTLMTYAVRGFTVDSADYGLGAQLSFRW